MQFKLLEKAPPACTQESQLPDLELFFQDIFLPSTVEMISNEVKVGVPSGRIVDIIGAEHRFMMSRLLVNEFLVEY